MSFAISSLYLKDRAMNERLTELEIKLSLTEDLVEELNRTVYRQQEQIDLLQAQLRLLYGQMQSNAEPGRDSSPLLNVVERRMNRRSSSLHASETNIHADFRASLTRLLIFVARPGA